MSPRRQFLAALAAAPSVSLAGAAADAAAGSPDPSTLRPVWRRAGDRWDRVRMYELRIGELFRVGDPTEEPELAAQTYRVATPPERDEHGQWLVYGSLLPA